MTRILILIFLFNFVALAYADTLYLKNGRSIEGLIKSEDGMVIELEVCQGVVKFEKNEIERIEKSTPQQAAAIRLKWVRQIEETQKRISKQRMEEERKPHKIEFSADNQSILVAVKLNEKVEVPLILDTGASMIMLRKNIAEKLGMDLDRIKPDMKVTLADGRQVNAKHIILKSVKVENVEAKNVDASILLDEAENLNFGDGLLGMSFLKRFNFKVDQKEKKLILEKF